MKEKQILDVAQEATKAVLDSYISTDSGSSDLDESSSYSSSLFVC
jgi:hypothetical protein